MIPQTGMLPLIAAATLAISLMMYALLDGTDLGVGIVFPLHRDAVSRNRMVKSILPIWDGNETWLVLGGGGLLAMFPLAYSILLTALYPLIIAMLMCLIFRGVAIEFRERSSPRERRWCDRAMFGGSTGAALCQGMTLGAIVQGVHVDGQQYAGGWWDWLTPFSLACGVTLVLTYALLGSCWLIWRCDGPLQYTARVQARGLAVLTFACAATLGGWMIIVRQMAVAATAERTAALHAAAALLPVLVRSVGGVPLPLVLLIAGVVSLGILMGWALYRHSDVLPLCAALGWVVLAQWGIGMALYPLMVPPALTIRMLAAPTSSQTFVLAGAALLIPTILAYSTYSFWIFRGKVH